MKTKICTILMTVFVALLLGSVFGIFFSEEDSGTDQTMQTVVREINADYDSRINEIKASAIYDKLEMSGIRAVWKDVLAVYSVKVNTDPDQSAGSRHDGRYEKQLLKDVFWKMNEINSRAETKSHTEIIETDDGYDHIL